MAAFLCGIAIWYFFIPVYYSFAIGSAGLVDLATYVIVITIILALVHQLQTVIGQLDGEKKLSSEVAARETLLVKEMQHRTKNLFVAVMQGLATQSLPPSEAREKFLGRLFALSVADQRMADSGAKGTSFRYLIDTRLKPFIGRYNLEGIINASLDPKTAENLSLVLHELATNATKYWALSTEQGRVELGWLQVARSNVDSNSSGRRSATYRSCHPNG